VRNSQLQEPSRDGESISGGRGSDLTTALAWQIQAHSDLGTHLEVSVRTERRCGYLPEPAAALTWTVAR